MYMYGMYETRNTTVDVIRIKVSSHSPFLFVLLLVLTFEFTLLAFDVFLLLCFTGNYSWN